MDRTPGALNLIWVLISLVIWILMWNSKPQRGPDSHLGLDIMGSEGLTAGPGVPG